MIRNDNQMSAGAFQICAGLPGHDAGSKAAIHAMRAIFEDNNTHAALLVDATNAFNLVNHQAALHNISVLCPFFSTILRNTYVATITLFVTGKCDTERTTYTQGDPLAMAMYSVCPCCHPIQGRIQDFYNGFSISKKLRYKNIAIWN